MNFKFQMNDVVEYNTGMTQGIGRVVGCAMTEQPVIGALYMIEDMSRNVPNATYPFRTLPCFEQGMKKLHDGEDYDKILDAVRQVVRVF